MEIHEIKLSTIIQKKLEKRKQGEKFIPTGTAAN